MSDIFREVEEEVRREQYAKLWKKYGDYILAAAALLILAVAGFQLWRYYDKRARDRASEEYSAAQQLVAANQPALAATAYAKLAETAPSGYAIVARLQHADALQAAGKRDEAIAIYRDIAAGKDPVLSVVARLREGWALVETDSRLQMETLLASLTDPTSGWRFMAREILAYSDYRAGGLKAAQKEFETLAGETEAPIGVRQRANAMAIFLKAGGDKDFGTIPSAPPPPAAKPAPDAPAPATPVKHRARVKRGVMKKGHAQK